MRIAQRFNLKNAPTEREMSPNGPFSEQNTAFSARATNRPFWTVCGARHPGPLLISGPCAGACKHWAFLTLGTRWDRPMRGRFVTTS